MGTIPTMAGTANNPIAIESGGVIYIYPAASFVSGTITMNIIVAPLDPTTGGYLTQGGTYDSPFSPDWENTIVEIAVQLFDKDKGNVR
jgi:hypothetical protein